MDSSELMNRIIGRADEMGISDHLHRLAGLDADRLDSLRRGDRLTASEFEQLCRAVAIDPAAMYRGLQASPERVPFRFRAAMSQDRPAPQDIRNLALAAEQGRILAYLFKLVGRPIPIAEQRRVQGIDGRSELWKEGYALGERARKRLGVESGPIGELERLLNELGIHVARLPMGSPAVSAASIWEPDAVPVVLLNTANTQNEHKGALRATLAHELCHLLHDAAERNITTRVSWSAENTGNYAEAAEARARAFAPAFIAPRDQVQGWSGTLDNTTKSDDRKLVEMIARHWGLSFEGAAWHAGNCGLLPRERVRKLAGTKNKPFVSLDAFESMDSWVPPAMVSPSLPEKPAPIWSGLATRVVLEALEEDAITAGRARELLTWG